MHIGCGVSQQDLATYVPFAPRKTPLVGSGVSLTPWWQTLLNKVTLFVFEFFQRLPCSIMLTPI